MNVDKCEKNFNETPINGARLSSSFGMRKHPILGFNKMHKGTDFAAILWEHLSWHLEMGR